MSSCRRYRLCACICLMLGRLVAGVVARLAWGVPEAPYGVGSIRTTLWGLTGWNRKANPLDELGHQSGYLAPEWMKQ